MYMIITWGSGATLFESTIKSNLISSPVKCSIQKIKQQLWLKFIGFK